MGNGEPPLLTVRMGNGEPPLLTVRVGNGEPPLLTVRMGNGEPPLLTVRVTKKGELPSSVSHQHRSTRRRGVLLYESIIPLVSAVCSVVPVCPCYISLLWNFSNHNLLLGFTATMIAIIGCTAILTPYGLPNSRLWVLRFPTPSSPTFLVITSTFLFSNEPASTTPQAPLCCHPSTWHRWWILH
jgi:putative component of membrane protein insertase Oxa1/YidC/SpoIIIJ protein YidD